jgi:hypothetical protein
LDFFVAQYTSSLAPKYDLEQHPSFSDYVRGLLWDHESNVPGTQLPHDPDKIAELKRRFPPKRLEGLLCFGWCSPKRESPASRLGTAMFHAEDDERKYLAKYPPEIAHATARSVEQQLANKWDQEQREIARRNDPREIFPITDEYMRTLNYDLARIPSGFRADADAEKEVLAILRDLPLDRAWWVAHKVAEYENFELLKLSSPDPKLKPDQSSGPPSVVARAAEAGAFLYRDLRTRPCHS